MEEGITMGACIAAAVAVAAASCGYVRSKDGLRPTPRRALFCACEYCGRAPDEGQKSAQCVTCGAHLKANAAYAMEGVEILARHSAGAWKVDDVRAEIKKEEHAWSSPPFESHMPSSYEPYVAPEEPKSEAYMPSPPMDMTDMLHPANPVGIFSPIWHQ